jgi:hypothetical protein
VLAEDEGSNSSNTGRRSHGRHGFGSSEETSLSCAVLETRAWEDLNRAKDQIPTGISYLRNFKEHLFKAERYTTSDDQVLKQIQKVSWHKWQAK